MEERIRAILILGSYLDTIGFNNGMYEFNFNYGKINNFIEGTFINQRILLDFMFKGGFEKFDLSKLNASDDTILMLYTGYAVVKKNPSFDNYRDNFIKSYKYLIDQEKRGSGFRTIESLKNLQKIKDKKIIYRFQSNGGGNGAAMRASVIGIRFRKNTDKLLDQAIMAGKMTHTHPYGYLGSVAVAYFIKCGLDNMLPSKWIRSFLDLYDTIHKKSNVTVEDRDYFNKFFIKLEEFDIKKDTFLDYNIKDGFYDINRLDLLINSGFEPAFNGKNYEKFGSTGLGVVIASLYFLFLSTKPHVKNMNSSSLKDIEIDWRMLFTLSSLNFADNDTIGIICGNFYGSIKGFKNIPNLNFKNLEFYKELVNLSKELNKTSI